MKEKLIHVVVACTVMLLLVAPQNEAAQNPDGDGKSFLWKVQTKTGNSYLFGSMHLARSDSYPLPRAVEESFAETGMLAVEADPGMAMAEEMQQRLVRSAIYPGNDTLQQHISQGTFALASKEMERLGLSIEQFARTKPWFLAMTIGVLELQQLGYSPEFGADLYFAGKARGKKKIVELESFDCQINLLNGFSDREQELFLLYTINEQRSLSEGMDELVKAWRTGDVKAIERLVKKAADEVPETRPMYEKLYDQRNRKMAAKIDGFLQSGENCFVIVGAAHLVGHGRDCRVVEAQRIPGGAVVMQLVSAVKKSLPLSRLFCCMGSKGLSGRRKLVGKIVIDDVNTDIFSSLPGVVEFAA